MRRADCVYSLLACVTLNCPLLRCKTEWVFCLIRRYSAIEHANLVILALLIQLVLLVVFYKSVSSCDTCRNYFWERVLGFTCWLESLVVLLDRLERIVLCLYGRHSRQV